MNVHAPITVTVHCDRCTVLPEGFSLGGSDTGLLLGGVIRGLVTKPDAAPVPADPAATPTAPAYVPKPALPWPDFGWWPFGNRQEN